MNMPYACSLQASDAVNSLILPNCLLYYFKCSSDLTAYYFKYLKIVLCTVDPSRFCIVTFFVCFTNQAAPWIPTWCQLMSRSG